MTRPVGPVEWEMESLAGARQAVAKEVVGGIGGIEFTLGASDSGEVSLQLLDQNGVALKQMGHVMAYLSDNDIGYGLAAVAPSGGVAAGDNGLLHEYEAGLLFSVFANGAGQADLVLAEAGAATWYLSVVLPNGNIVTSDAIVFTA